jgi:hypothetical protein
MISDILHRETNYQRPGAPSVAPCAKGGPGAGARFHINPNAAFVFLLESQFTSQNSRFSRVPFNGQPLGHRFSHLEFEISNLKSAFFSPLVYPENSPVANSKGHPPRHSSTFPGLSPCPSHPIPPRTKRRRRETQLAHRVSGGKKAARSAHLLCCFSRAILWGARRQPPRRLDFRHLSERGLRFSSRITNHKSQAALFSIHHPPLTNHQSRFHPHSSSRHKGSPFFLRSGVFHFCSVRNKGPVLSRGCLHYISTHSTLLPHPSRERSKEATTCKEVLFVS